MQLMPKSCLPLALLAATSSFLDDSVSAFQSSSLISHNRRKLQPLHSSPTQTSSTSSSSNNDSSTSLNSSPPKISAAIQSHHVAVKTRNIELAIKFYSLLGFHVETKFVAGPARAAWLLHGDPDDEQSCPSSSSTTVKSRIELIEVPSYMLNEPEGMKRRALDLTKREELLGLNHFCLDVTHCIPKPSNSGSSGGDASLISNINDVPTTSSDSSSSCSLYNLQEWLDDLNQLSISTFGKSLRIALEPTKRIIGRDVYEMAFIYDADGTLVELLKWSNRLEQEIGSGWEPWDGKGFVA